MMFAFLTSASSKLVAYLIVAVLLIAGGAYGQHKIDLGNMEKQTLQYQQAIDAANTISADLQHQQDQDAIAAASAYGSAQEAQANVLQQELSYAKAHTLVKSIPCVPYDLVRMLDAAVLGVSPTSLSFPPGKSGNSCSPFTADELAATITSNYGAANANAEQLNAVLSLIQKYQADARKAGAK